MDKLWLESIACIDSLEARAKVSKAQADAYASQRMDRSYAASAENKEAPQRSRELKVFLLSL
ncbi:hypothetical protein [uncultured Pontibacter sp.]|uniref:hypothetical protein n=1 Tax=uncultured Pontibacter sp. TaxID=453356 RepID=UPI00262E66C4|nr:hypothetical protein [uncultured Pontibacter sp.]